MASEKDKRPELRELQQVLESGGDLATFLEEVHPADLAEWLPELEDEERERAFRALDDEKRAEVLTFAEDPMREDLLARIGVQQIVRIVEELPADEAVDLLALTDDATSDQVLRTVDFERAQGLRELSRYDAETAGGLMTSEFVTVPADAFVSDAIKLIKQEEGPASEEEGGVFVVDEDNKPVGFVSDRELLTTQIHTPLREVMDEVITAPLDADQEEVAQLVHKYSLNALPIVDTSGVIVGIVSGEDALDVLQEEAEEDILKLVGTSADDQTRLPVLTRVRVRIPLQALTVLGGLVTAWILDKWLASPESAGGGSSASDVLRYLPIIIGLAGNVGIQSSTILVRAFATGELSQEREVSVLGSEVLTGLLIGLICGATTMLVASLLENGDDALRFGYAVGAAITVAVTWAAFLGCVVPISCQRFGIDPAVVAGPFLITLSDISGAAILVGVSYLALGLGG